MAISLLPALSNVMPSVPVQFNGTGGTAPYAYAVLAGGAGGTIDSATGVYKAPANLNPDPYNHPEMNRDTVRVTDSLGATATGVVRVGGVLQMLADIVQSEMVLADDQVYLWDQKITPPTDSRLYVAVGAFQPKPFGSSNKLDASGNSVQSVNMVQNCSFDIMSRGPSARDRKEEIIMALSSVYAQQQMALNSFDIGKLSTNFVNLSQVDGAAIPYRFNISVNVQYAVTKTKPVPYYDDFAPVDVTTEP